MPGDLRLLRSFKTACLLISVTALGAPAAAPAAAQEADPIGALLQQIPQSPAEDLEEPDTGGVAPQIEPDPALPGRPIPYSTLPQSPAARPPRPYVAPSGAVAPVPYVPPPRSATRPEITEPVDLMDVGRTPEGPPSVNALAYDSRLRSSFASAQSFQGPLDGSWTLSDGGQPIYVFQLVDRGKGVLEGVWRDLRASGSSEGSGFVDEIGRSTGGLTMAFAAPRGQVSLTLSGGYSGVWQGRMTEGGRSREVSLRKDR